MTGWIHRGVSALRWLPGLLLCLSLAAGAAEPQATELMSRGQQAFDQGEMAGAESLFSRALAAFEASQGESHADTLMALERLAETLEQLGRHDEARQRVEALLARRRARLGEDHPDTLRALSLLAGSLASLGQIAQALAIDEQVLERRLASQGERHPEAMQAMSNLAYSYGELGRYGEQVALNQRALRLQTEVLGATHVDTMTTLHNLALALGSAGRLREAAEHARQVVEQRRERLGEHHPDSLSSLAAWAELLNKQGRHAQAAGLGEQVLARRTQLLGEQHPLRLISMNNLAAVYSALGRGSEAMALLQHAYAMSVQRLGARHPDTLLALANLAFVYGTLGLAAEAVALNEALLAQRIEVLGEKHPNTLLSMGNLALAYGAVGRQAERLALDERALKLRTEVLGEKHPLTLRLLANVAGSQMANGQLETALATSEGALALDIEVLGDRHSQTLSARHQLAAVLALQGQAKPAADLAALALAQRRESLGGAHPDTLASALLLAQQLSRLGRLAEAAALSADYVAGAEGQRSQPGLTADKRQSVFKSYADGYRLFAGLHAGLDQLAPAWRLAELGKARTLLEALASQRAERGGALPAAQQDALDDLRRQLAAHERLLALADSAEARVNLEARRNELQREHDALLQRLRTAFPKFATLSDVRLVSAAEAAAALPRDTLALSYVLQGDRLLAFSLARHAPLRVHDLGQVRQLGELVDLYRRASAWHGGLADILLAQSRRAWLTQDGELQLLPADRPPPPAAAAVTDAATIGRHLAARLLQPLAARLSGQPRWIVSPDGPLAQLPFETLPWRGRRVLDHGELLYTPSLSVFVAARELKQRYGRLPARRALFAMGNPQFLGEAAAAPGPDGQPPLRQTGVGAVEPLAVLDRHWVALPGTEAEVRAVQRLFGSDASVQLGALATEARLQQLHARGELRRFRWLLFATHGYLSPTQPALSAIVLGMRDLAPGTDGYVTAAEWPGYDLRSDLVVLSACDTGVGPVLAGEGVMGLPFALQVAGNVNTILTLWPVDDRATALFVTRLFARLKAGTGPAKALALTKREFARSSRHSHPRFWAPFMLIGAG